MKAQQHKNMNPETFDMQAYIQQLPPKVQAIISSNEWEEKTFEIGKKYALTPEQTQSLADIVLLSLAGIEKPETLQETIMSDLEISQLLSEQIFEDLDIRVFEYALKQIEEKPKNTYRPQSTLNTGNNASRVPEIKPDNLPAVEIGEVAKPYVPQPASQPQYKTSPAMRAPEPAQKPYSVPRFGLSSVPPKVETLNLNQKKPENAQSTMDAKLNNVTVNMGDSFAPKKEENPARPPTKYDADPYREPLG